MSPTIIDPSKPQRIQNIQSSDRGKKALYYGKVALGIIALIIGFGLLIELAFGIILIMLGLYLISSFIKK